jgi:hypothetical protein
MKILTANQTRDFLVWEVPGTNARPCKTVSCDGDGNERLPCFHRTIRLPGSLWRAVRRRGLRDGKAIRWVVEEALDAELAELVEQLRRLGLRGELADDRLVRLPMDDNVRGRILCGRRQTGLPAVLLLKLCLMRHCGKER